MLAAVKGNTAAVKWLLDNGADKFLRQKDEATALDFALRRHHPKVAKLLEGEPIKVVPQQKREEAERLLQEEVKKADEMASKVSGTTGTTGTSSKQESGKTKSKDGQLPNAAAKMVKEYGKQKSKKLASSLTNAGIGQ